MQVFLLLFSSPSQLITRQKRGLYLLLGGLPLPKIQLLGRPTFGAPGDFR